MTSNNNVLLMNFEGRIKNRRERCHVRFLQNHGPQKKNTQPGPQLEHPLCIFFFVAWITLWISHVLLCTSDEKLTCTLEAQNKTELLIKIMINFFFIIAPENHLKNIPLLSINNSVLFIHIDITDFIYQSKTKTNLVFFQMSMLSLF